MARPKKQVDNVTGSVVKNESLVEHPPISNLPQPAMPTDKPRKRIPVSGRNRMATPEMPGYVLRWAHNTAQKPDRIQDLLNAGYQFVTKDMLSKDADLGFDRPTDGKSLDSRVSKTVGAGMTSYLMRQTEENWREDDDARRAVDKKLEEQITSGNKAREEVGGNTYGNVSSNHARYKG